MSGWYFGGDDWERDGDGVVCSQVGLGCGNGFLERGYKLGEILGSGGVVGGECGFLGRLIWGSVAGFDREMGKGRDRDGEDIRVLNDYVVLEILERKVRRLARLKRRSRGSDLGQ